MRFRPCIDIHNGKVKQIVGGSLKDEGNLAKENFVSEQDAAFFADLYNKKGLSGGHIIILNSSDSPFYKASYDQAISALNRTPGKLQIGGGINSHNAEEFLYAGASQVIVTSFVFSNGKVHYDNLKELVNVTGKDRLVLDLSCKKHDGKYFIVTDRWQNMTDVEVNKETLDNMSDYCSEILVHAVDVEGKQSGIEEDIAKLLGEWGKLPVTYAGGVHTLDDIKLLKKCGRDRLDVTVGSALDIFGGNLSLDEIIEVCR